MKRFKFKTLCCKSGIKKASGYSATEILTLLMMLPLMMLKNIHQLYKSDYAKKEKLQKDTIYRLKNNENYPWRRLLYAVAKVFKSLVSVDEVGDKKITALILDDTTDQKTGYKMENISYVFDHVLRKSVYGFKILALTFFDGTTNYPLDFTVHSEKKLERKKAKKQYKKKIDPKSCGAKRRKEANTSKAEQAVILMKRAIKHGFRADYLLCDSWFTSENLIKEVRKAANGTMHIIAGVANDNRKYNHGGELFNAKEIISLLKKEGKAHRCRRWNTRYFEAVVQYKGAGEVKLFMSRFPWQKKWRVFITTNTSLSYVQMMEIYGIRWTIEVMFRECKQQLNLGICQSQDFDAQIANTSITFMLYIFLSYMKRKEAYDETLGELFRLTQQDIRQKNLAERLFALFEELLVWALESISSGDAMDMSQLLNSEEYRYIREVLASSFLFEQLESVNNAV
jgi:hypothetical protein